MTISISRQEFDAIHFAIDQIRTDMEAADEEYARDAEVAIDNLYSISRKYLKKREEANYFQQVRLSVSKRNPNMKPQDVDKLTRRLIKQIKKGD